MHICFFSPGNWQVPQDQIEAQQHRCSKIVGDLSAMIGSVLERNPNVVFISGFAPNTALLDALSGLSAVLPSAAIIPVVKSPEPSFLIEVMRRGVREVIASDSSDEILQTLTRVKDLVTPQKKKEAAKKSARRIGLMSAKGGDGGSFLSANIAATLAQDEGTRVLLVDLAIPFGDVEMYVSSDNVGNDVSEITAEIDRMDHALLNSMVHHFSDHFDFVASPRSFEKVIQLQPAQIEKLIDLAAMNYDYVIIDIGTGFDPITLRTIEKLDQLLLVATQSVPSIRRAGQIMRLLESVGFSMPRLSIIVNKYSPKEPIGHPEIESALRKAPGREFGLDADGVRESIVKGIPYVSLYPKSDLTRAIGELVGDWLGKPKESKPLWRRFGIK